MGVAAHGAACGTRAAAACFVCCASGTAVLQQQQQQFTHLTSHLTSCLQVRRRVVM